MKKFNRLLLISILLPVLSSCGRHTCCPALIPDAFVTGDVCDLPFVRGTHRLIHSVEGRLPDKKYLSVIGVTVVDSESRRLHCIIMTVEGFVLFDAVYDQKLTVHRGIPPFDSEAFANGMISDVRLIFFKPDAELIQTGLSHRGELICRYKDADQGVTDVVTNREHYWEIRRYDSRSVLIRTVKGFTDKDAAASGQPVIPNRLEFTAYGETPYALKLNLIQYESF